METPDLGALTDAIADALVASPTYTHHSASRAFHADVDAIAEAVLSALRPAVGAA